MRLAIRKMPFVCFVAGLVLGCGGLGSRADTLYVTNQSGADVVQYTPDGTQSEFYVGGANGAALEVPEGLAFDSMGNLFVANGGSTHSVIKISPDRTGSTFATVNGPVGGGMLGGLAVDRANNVYVADNYDGTILLKFTPDGSGSVFASGLSNLWSLAFDGSGNLYAGDGGDGIVEKFTPGGVGSVFVQDSQLIGMYGLAFDGTGNLFASNGANFTIQKISPEGTISLFGTTPIEPHGLAIDSAGDLYVFCVNGPFSIQEFTPDGVSTAFYEGGGPNAGLATFYPGVTPGAASPVPLPSAASAGYGLVALLGAGRVYNRWRRSRRA